MKFTRNAHPIRLGFCFAALLFATLLAPAISATIDEQLKAISVSLESQPESAIISLLKAGLEEGNPTLAIAATEKWLRQNLPNDPMLLYYAGRSAELSGDWKSAVALYQQYLRKADIKSATADEAVYAVYTLLIQQLEDTSGAYAFGRNEGNRVMVCPRARQFDQWFLDEAVRRQDPEAVANRLRAGIEADLPNDLLVARYSPYFRWLLEQVDGYIERGRTAPVNDELVAAYKQLAAAMKFEEEMALRLDWAVSVRAYNLGRTGGEGGKPKGKGKKKGPTGEENATELANTAPPIAEAKALLEKYPRNAQWVQTGWAGGGNGQYYRNDPAKYWPHEIDAKMAPVVAAAARLTPLELSGLLESWSDRYYSDNTVRPVEVKVVREYLLANPELINSRSGPIVAAKPWNELPPEELAKLAPQVAQNTHVDASLIRAAAAGGKEKNFDKALEALVGPEAWRLPQHHDQRNAHYRALERYCGAQPSEEAKQKWATLDGGLNTVDAKKEDPPAQRITVFRKLWKDYRSPEPKLPSVYERLEKVLQFTPEAVPELLRDASPEAQILARHAIASGMSGPDPLWVEMETASKVNVSRYAPGILDLAQRYRSIDEMKSRYPQKCKPHPLETALRQSVTDGLQQKKLEPWQVMAWINMQFPEDNADQVKLIQDLFRSPAWKSMPFEVHYAAREWFKKDAMTPAQVAWVDAADPALACKDLLALPKEAANAATLAALNSAIEGVKNSPVKIEIQGLGKLAEVSDEVFTDPKLIERLLEVADGLRVSCDRDTEPMAARLLAHVTKKRDPVMAQRTAAFLWSYGKSEHYANSLATTLQFAQSFLDKHPATASAMAKTGLSSFANGAQHHQKNWLETGQPALKTIVGKAAMSMGLISIPVPRNHPAYPVYESQAEWITGNEDSAGNLIDENWDQLLAVYRELSVPFLLWTLQRAIYSREEARQESLVKVLLEWSGQAGSPFTLAEKIGLEIAYGDIAMQRGQLREAHEIYSRTQNNEAYREVLAVHDATLRRARAERIAKNFDGALQTLADLDLQRIPEIWSATRYARAEVFFDMEEYGDAADEIDDILAREPNHADAKIMLGKVQLKREKLMEATEVELGSAMDQKTLVPGEKLKVTLTDPTLDVSGAGTEIEVIVWTTSGDREQFFLRRFGDQKTKFRGEVLTALGAPSPDDGILQVIGDDEIFYAYSERYRAKMNNLPEKRGGPITVASDALLIVSARKLLTEAEQRVADLEMVMDQVTKGKSRDATTEAAAKMALAARKLDAAERSEAGASESESEFEAFISNVVKPGNPVHVRVIDPDRSRTAGIDELTVSVQSSSGDSISRITLKETGTHTGWFEGSVPTTEAQAMAFGPNSEPGRNPNMVISPNEGYPAWRPVAAKDAVPEFTVDLNDNVPLGEMKITAAEAGSRLQKFIVQTAMNHSSWTDVAQFPKNRTLPEDPWKPSVLVMNDTDRHHAQYPPVRTVFDREEILEQVERGWITQTYAQSWVGNVSGPTGAMPEAVIKDVKWKRQNRSDVSHVIYRFRGHFYEPENVTRKFRLSLGNYVIPANTHPSIKDPPQFMLAVDGRRITGEDGRLEGEINLRPGVHRFEIWSTGWVNNMGFGRDCKLEANLNDPEQYTLCPDSFFDPASFPPGVAEQRNGAATIAANDEGTGFTVKFAPNSRTRLIRLIIAQHEGAVPAINKITLKQPDDKQILPVPEDFATLNKNDTLEILADDKLSVRYIDDRFVTKTKQKHERFLDVRFTNARVEFADMEPRLGRSGKMEPFYEKLLRFPYSEPLSLAIRDADMDVSVEPDTVKVKVAIGKGEAREFEVPETGDSTGLFRLILTPVAKIVPPADGETGPVNPIVVPQGETIIATYYDEETTQPGVATDRVGTITHALFHEPELRLGHAEEVIYRDKNQEAGLEPIWLLKSKLIPVDKAPEGGFALVHGRVAYLELKVPHLAQRKSSTLTVFAQTDQGRKSASATPSEAAAPNESPRFDIRVPGTIALTGSLASTSAAELRLDNNSPSAREALRRLSRNYSGGEVWKGIDINDTERFRFSVPLLPGLLPEYGYLSPEEREELTRQAASSRLDETLDFDLNGLVVQPGERIHFGFRYLDEEGAEQWLTASARVITHPLFSIMDADFRQTVTSAYAGETLYLRVADLGGDVTDAADTVSLLMQAKSGGKSLVELRETDPHSGIFTAGYFLSYASKAGPLPEGYDVKSGGFPVTYGDTVAARYADGNGIKTETQFVTISKGADGRIEPFSKKYDDPDIAMRTQFSLAEAYLEMAKRHRKLGENELAEQEYSSAKQLLASAMDQFKDPETRAHAEYLLGNLTLEEAVATPDTDTRETRFRAALSRFMTVTGSYPDTIHASKAQFKIATVYEALKEPDIAAQEYVKLAYKYPDSEFLATAMARLGSHFLKKAAGFEGQAKPLLAKGETEEDKDALFQGQELQKMAVREYLKTAKIFEQLQKRFPGNELAGQAGLRGGQAYLRAGKNQEALAAFLDVANEEGYKKEERSASMYWAGMCYQNLRQQMAAYSIFKRLTYDFPETEWAAYARGQLSQPGLLKLETELEIERLEGGQ